MIDTSRMQFEFWAEDRGLDIKDSIIPGCYAEPETQIAWDSWKGSRESIVIVLSHPGYEVPDSYHTGQCQYRAIAAKAIEAAGVKVAP